MLKIALISSIRPETNYTTYLISALQKLKLPDLEVLVYTDKDPRNAVVPLQNVNLVYDRDWPFVFQVAKKAYSDRVALVHLQQEINMYGGPRTAILFPFLILFLRLLKIRVVVTVHAAIPTRLIDRRMLEVFGWPYPRLFSPFVRIVFPLVYFLIGCFSERIIVHTKTIKDCLANDYFVKRGKITIIPHGVPETAEVGAVTKERGWLKQIEGRKIILYFGYLHRRKGLEYLLSAFKIIADKFKDYSLVLAGGTVQESYLEALREFVKEDSLRSRVVFTGFIELPELRFLMERCEFVVLPAVYSIAASGPLAQVFAHEKPVIVTKVGSYAEEIRDEVNGLLAEAQNPDYLARQMERLIEDGSLRSRIVQEVKKIHTERAWPKIAFQTVALYKDLV